MSFNSDGVYIGPENLEGSLDLRRYRDTLTSLGKLKMVGGDLDIRGCTGLTTLGKLKKVGWWLFLDDCTSLTTLGDLETVGGFLDLTGCTGLKTLENLKIVGGWLDLKGCSSLTSLGYLETVNSNIYLHGNKEVSLKEVQDKIRYYSAMQAHEALNAIHSQEVQEVPLYKNFLMENLQKG